MALLPLSDQRIAALLSPFSDLTETSLTACTIRLWHEEAKQQVNADLLQQLVKDKTIASADLSSDVDDDWTKLDEMGNPGKRPTGWLYLFVKFSYPIFTPDHLAQQA